MNANRQKCFRTGIAREICSTACCVAMLFLMSGCHQVFLVNKDGIEQKGIPFYVKKAMCQHKSVYAVPYYKITLQMMEADEAAASSSQSQGGETAAATSTVTISSRAYHEKDVQDFLLKIYKKKFTEEEKKDLLKEWNKISESNGEPHEKFTANDSGWLKYLISNDSSPVVAVDYGNPYTLNTQAPAIGTANADFTLNADGTLSNAKGQIEEKTLSTILSTFTDTIESVATLVTAVKELAGAEQKLKMTPITFKITTEKRYLKITRSRYEDFRVGCRTDGGNVDDAQADTLIEDIGGSDSAKETKAAGTADDNSIKISGTVSLPKTSGTDTKDKK